VLLTISPYLPLVYYTTGMANLKKGCFKLKIMEKLPSSMHELGGVNKYVHLVNITRGNE